MCESAGQWGRIEWEGLPHMVAMRVVLPAPTKTHSIPIAKRLGLPAKSSVLTKPLLIDLETKLPSKRRHTEIL